MLICGAVLDSLPANLTDCGCPLFQQLFPAPHLLAEFLVPILYRLEYVVGYGQEPLLAVYSSDLYQLLDDGFDELRVGWEVLPLKFASLLFYTPYTALLVKHVTLAQLSTVVCVASKPLILRVRIPRGHVLSWAFLVILGYMFVLIFIQFLDNLLQFCQVALDFGPIDIICL